jgi:hypothetical protein
MTLSVRDGGTWRTVATNRLQYVRVDGAWTPIMDIWVRAGGAWVKDAYSAPVLAMPTNVRMNAPDATNHATIPIAWDFTLPTGGTPPTNFDVLLTDEGGTWLRLVTVDGATRSYTFTSVAPNTRYKMWVRATVTNNTRGPTLWAGPVNWFLGQDSYVLSDVPVYDWAPDVDGSRIYWSPGPASAFIEASSEALGFPAYYAIDNNLSSRWKTALAPESGSLQGEGIRFKMPGGHFLMRYVFVSAPYPVTAWVGVFRATAWQGALTVYSGKYGHFQHNYVAGFGPQASFLLNIGDWITDSTSDGMIDVLLQNPTDEGGGPTLSAWEIQPVLLPWIQTGWSTRTVAAINSATY